MGLPQKRWRGVYGFGSSAVFENCTLSVNRAHGNMFMIGAGGGVYCESDWSTFTNCILTGNRASGPIGSYGGAVYCYSSSPTFRNCTLSGDTASTGGGVYVRDSWPTINSTIIAFSSSSGIYFWNSSTSQVWYCDISENPDGDICFYEDNPLHGPPGIGVTGPTNANGDPCDGYKNIFLDPRFVDSPTDDIHLTDISHCIGAGDPTNPPPTDFEGDPRPNPPGSKPDIGIDEHWLGYPSVERLVISIVSGNTVLHWPYFPYTVNIYGATTPFTPGTLLDSVTGVSTWTDINTASRPSPYFYYVTAVE